VSSVYSFDKDGNTIETTYLQTNGAFSIEADPNGYLVFYITDPENPNKGIPEKTVKVQTVLNSGGLVNVSTGFSPLLLLAGAGVAAAVAIGADANKGKKSVGKVPQEVQTGLYILGGLLAFNTVKSLLEKLGLLTGQNTQIVLDAQSNPASPWNPNFWMSAPGGVYSFAFTESQAGQLCKQIHDAFGLFSDNVEQVTAAIKQCKTQANLSFVAWEFQKIYNADLLTFLRNGGGVLPWDGVSDSVIASLNSYILSLPKY
jgi:hypothetical protein